MKYLLIVLACVVAIHAGHQPQDRRPDNSEAGHANSGRESGYRGGPSGGRDDGRAFYVEVTSHKVNSHQRSEGVKVGGSMGLDRQSYGADRASGYNRQHNNRGGNRAGH